MSSVLHAHYRRTVASSYRKKLIGYYSQGRDSGVEGFPLRAWSIEIYLLNEHGEEVPATLFDKVIYRLHPSFGDRANQSTFFA